MKNSKILRVALALSSLAMITTGCIEDPAAPNTGDVQPVSAFSAPSKALNLPVPKHTVIVVLENHALSQIIDKASAPYINQLADSGALFTESYGVTHPSQPNYLHLFSGTNQGVTDDNQSKNIPFTTQNLGASLIATNHTFIGYSEDLPSVGFTGATSGTYGSKHSPWVNWQGTGENQVPPEVNQPLTNFPQDYNNLPDVSFVIPNMDDDMHNGIFTPIIKTGDQWLKDHLDSYVQWAKNNNSLFILTFDEDNRFHDNRITTIFVGPMIKPGIYNGKLDHHNVLRTLEDIYKLPYAGDSATADPITGCWQ